MHWAKALHVPDHSVEKLIKEAPTFGMPASGPTPEMLRLVAKEMPKLLWRIAGFRDPMPAFEQAVHFKLPPKVAAFNWCEHANQAKSAGDLDTAIQHARTAIERNPELGYAHFQLGAFLGEKLRDDPRLRNHDALIRQAITECRVGWQLDPTLPISLNEVGIILSNVGRFEEAELAYAEAADPCAELEHHHFCRARNHLALGDEAAALAGFERVLQLKPDHLQAMAHLSVLYQKHGRKRDSNTLADRLRQRVGEDPRDHTEDWLDPFYVRHLYVPRRGFRP
jgi:tetratricopeptide (TPR) repeat protein